ncbi:MAG: hypothetical protein ABI183_12315 [Polyangiaceae bacterium]
MRPFFAGAITGIFGGGAMLAVVDTLMARHSDLRHPFLLPSVAIRSREKLSWQIRLLECVGQQLRE